MGPGRLARLRQRVADREAESPRRYPSPASVRERHLLTSNALWDSRIARENRLMDVQLGAEIGLVTKAARR